MQLFSWNLEAGVDNHWPGTGRYMRILQGQGDLRVKVHYANGDNIESDMLAGIGVDLRGWQDGAAFNGITFRSSQTETIKVLVSNFPTTDSRLVGDIAVQGDLDTVPFGGNEREALSKVWAASIAELLPADNNRVKATIYSDSAVNYYYGPDGADFVFQTPPGTYYIDENRAALYYRFVGPDSGQVLYAAIDKKV